MRSIQLGGALGMLIFGALGLFLLGTGLRNVARARASVSRRLARLVKSSGAIQGPVRSR